MVKPRFSVDAALPWAFALVKLFVHLGTNLAGGYGFHRDELYYIACSDHMAWGYVDQPPLSIAVLWASRLMFGDSLFAVRLLPAVSGALVVGLTGIITKELGGGRFARTLACCCVLAAPLLLGMDSMFSMNSFDTLFWTAAILVLVRLITSGDRTYWIYLALVLGLGLQNKISVLWLGAGIVTAFVLTSHRTWFLRRDPWVAAAMILALFGPHIIWQVANGYPTLEFIRNASSGKYVALSPVDLLLQQALFMNPLTLPIWVGGIVYFLAGTSARPFRILPIIYMTVFLILAVNVNSKAAYLAPLIPMLFATGGVAVEAFVQRRGWMWMRPALIVAVLASGAALSPLVLAILPVDAYVRYAGALGVGASTSENHEMGLLPQHYADMFGWEEMVADVAKAYGSLTVEEQAQCAIFCGNYGEAGAIDFFGRKHGLPRSISGHNNYWLWGPRGATGAVVIRLGGSEEMLKEYYGEVTRIGFHEHPYSMRYESNMTIWLCKNRRASLAEDWAEFKVFN
jgi:hypothetical protein